jgi:hypothetical protein
MAKKRSLSTTLFASPDFFELSSNTVRLIFIGLILDADDEGRGCAHPRLLARKLDQAPEEIEQALEELVSHDMVQCYEVAGRHLYWLCHWHRYQTLSKPTPSHFPAPPAQKESPGQEGNRAFSEVTRFSDTEVQSVSATCAAPSASVAPLIVPQVASALHLPESEALAQIVQEFVDHPTLSLLGEAIEARAWIEDQRRNTHRQLMTPAFFRRWLRRSQQTTTPYAQTQTKKGTERTGNKGHVPDQYEVYIKALQARYNDPEVLQEVGL